MRQRRRNNPDMVLNIVLTGLAIFVLGLILLLLANHFHEERDNEIIARADYLIARSEASIERWQNGTFR